MNQQANTSDKKAALQWLGRIATVLVSAGIIYYFLRQVEWDDLKEAVAGANLPLALLGGTVPLFFFWIMDAAFTVKSFEWFDKPVRFRDFFVLKAALYLLTLVNITIATGGVFLYFMRKTGVSAKKQAGIMAWRLFIAGLGAMMFLAAMMLAVKLISPQVAEEVTVEVWGPLVLLVAALALEPAAFWFRGGGLILKRLNLKYQAEFWAAFRGAGPRHWLIGLGYTVPPIVVNFVCMYVVARAFHIDVPFFYFMFWIPVALAFAALPIAFGQLGTTTAAWQFFFAAYATDADIFAATIFIPTLRLIWRGAIGGLFTLLAMREIESLMKK